MPPLHHLLLLLACVTGPAWAAGGHHAVDDATLIAPGQCEVETWASRQAGGTWELHAGPGCRVGPVELSVAGNRAWHPAQHRGSFQAKYARPIAGLWQGGASLTVERSDDPAAPGSATAMLLATWSQSPVALHLNAGRTHLRGAGSAWRWGVAADWDFAPRWLATLEIYREPAATWARAGLRYTLREGWTLDASRATSVRGIAPGTWVVGASWAFDR